MTVVSGGAEVVVIAGCAVEHEGTAPFRSAAIGGTDVVIVTDKPAVKDTGAAGTMVPGGAGVAIVTQRVVGRVGTAPLRTAQVIRTTIAIVADNGVAGLAYPIQTLVVSRATVAILARSLVE